ncbi:CEI_1a_G0003720.mRNA.1.CDS.1 [Saccharomyces cerevisiae]|nr:EM14S01-3B_G0015630.mRNA.1.CDS.1 [Saccharomyces cerevisiae]CAI4276963.1 AMH_1a_G0003870.mRNA.1.CDS.1 [Saccharomyces cerevisiae]CAI4279686.1 CEI_1a_G0003720.mRNA.1.CDS.1 [Saccharomyces cerevisiae]CAI6501413.1 AMH_1a_G0003870.mRNA.1.CDS.1 [Saccharomyces cerevisiae]CAI7152105.1 CEI_1a_G0003720.mRNA.1.CDS.1 [Saccharomyces cerevisiae]
MSRVYIYPLTVFYFLAIEMSVFCYYNWFYRRNFPYFLRPIFFAPFFLFSMFSYLKKVLPS